MNKCELKIKTSYLITIDPTKARLSELYCEKPLRTEFFSSRQNESKKFVTKNCYRSATAEKHFRQLTMS